MGISIGIFKVEKLDLLGRIERDKEIKIVSGQTSMSDFLDDAGLPSPTSTIKLAHKSENQIVYKVEHYTDTIRRPIRTWKSHLVVDSGYQEIANIEVVHDLQKNELYIMAKKDVVDEFADRLKTLKDLVKIEKYNFNLNITQIQEILNVYGIWDKVSQGNIKVSAKFGSNVLESIRAGDSTIAINMKVKMDDNEFDVTISREGQISTHSGNITFRELLRFFEILREELLGS
jgi:hypothetical protein